MVSENGSGLTSYNYGWDKIPHGNQPRARCVAYNSSEKWSIFNCSSRFGFICQYGEVQTFLFYKTSFA